MQGSRTQGACEIGAFLLQMCTDTAPPSVPRQGLAPPSVPLQGRAPPSYPGSVACAHRNGLAEEASAPFPVPADDRKPNPSLHGTCRATPSKRQPSRFLS